MNLANSSTWREFKITKYRVRIEVKLKSGHVDSEGLTTEKALKDLGYEVEKVSTAKIFYIYIKASTLEGVREQADEMCRKLLANPIKDDYEIEVEEAG